MLQLILLLASLITGITCLFLFSFFVFKNKAQIYVCISAFWFAALAFHLATFFRFITPGGLLTGPASVTFILILAQRFYKPSTDQPPAQGNMPGLTRESILFLGGAGLWLGPADGTLAMVLSSLFALAFAAANLYRKKQKGAGLSKTGTGISQPGNVRAYPLCFSRHFFFRFAETKVTTGVCFSGGLITTALLHWLF